jgi:uncharacterized protein (TIGR02646 family)
MRIERGNDPGPFNNPRDYKRKYKPFLRSLFRCRCAYCQTQDDYFGGEDAATVDHFKPEGRFHELRFTWSNLYYACHVCNCHYKKQHPTVAEEAQGKRFVDPCAEDPEDHFRLVRDNSTGEFSRIRPLSPAAEYTNFRLKFNHRKSLRDYWRLLDRQERELAQSLSEIERGLQICSGLEVRLNDSNDSAITSLKDDFESRKRHCLSELDRVRSLRPFPIEGA